MNCLPVEVLSIICAEHLGHDDILSFRQVCEAFAVVGARHMLPSISIAAIPESLRCLEAVSEHTVLRHHFTTVVYEVDVLQKIGSFEEYVYEARHCRSNDFFFG